MEVNFEGLKEPSIYNVLIKSKPSVKGCFAKMSACVFSFYKCQMQINVSIAQTSGYGNTEV